MIGYMALKVAVAFVVVWLVGYAVLGTLFGRAKVFAPVERFFVAFMVGAGALTLALTYLGFAGMPLRFRYCFIAVVVVLAPWLVWLEKKGRLVFELRGVVETLRRAMCPGKGSEGVVTSIVLLVILFQCVFVGAEALMRPFNMEDAMGFWGLSVNMIFHTYRLPPTTFAANSHYYTTFNNATLYPPMLYLFGYWISAASGSMSASLCKSVLIVCFVGFLALFYYALRRIMSQMWSLVFTALLGITPVLSRGFTVFYADAFVTAALSLGVAYLYLFMLKGERQMLLLSSLFFALAAWLKVEGTIYFLFGVGTLIIFLASTRGQSIREKARRLLLFSIIPLFVVVPYYAIRLHQRGSHYFITPSGKLRQFDRIKEMKLIDGTVMPQLYENLASYRPFIYQYRYFRFSKLGDWLFAWQALVFALLISPSRIVRVRVSYLLLYLVLFFAFHYYFAVMLGPAGAMFHFSRGFARHFMHGIGFVVLMIAVLLCPHTVSIRSSDAPAEKTP